MPYSQDFNDEFFYSPKEEELHDVAYGPRGKSRPATVGGAFGRFLRKTVADPIRGMARSVEKARSSGFSSPEEMGRAALDFAGNLVGTPSFGGGLGSGARMKAAPWQSRTLDAILGESPVGKKFPQTATPQTWLSKLKGAGLPKDEITAAEKAIEVMDPKSKWSRKDLAFGLENVGKLPELGVTRTELGGPKWEAVQKRLPKIGDRINELKLIMAKMQQEAKIPEGITLRKPADVIDTGKIFSYLRKNNPEFSKLAEERAALIAQQSELANWSAGKRPGWPEHNIEELKSPREVLYHAPPKEGGEYSNHDMRLHYPGKDKNLLFHQREGILEFPDGKKSTHISEQQSDWISEYEKVNSPTLTDYEGKKYKRKELEVRPMSVVGGGSVEKSWGIFTKSGEEAPDLPTYSSRVEAESVLIPEPISTPPMKDSWWKMGLKDAVKRAVEAGHDYLTWDTPETIIERGGGKIKGVAENHYGKNVPGFLKKEYGVEAKRVGTGSKQSTNVDEAFTDIDFEPNKAGPEREVFQVPITEEMKRKVLLEGQYFSKQTAKPGGRDAEMAA